MSNLLARCWADRLELTNKEKSGRERTSYTAVELRALFLKDVSTEIGKPVAYEQWEVHEDKTRDAQIAPNLEQEARASGTATLEDHSDASWNAAQ